MKKIFFNGKIYLEREKFAEAILISDDIIEKVGNNEEILALCPEAEKIDCGGRTVLPGLNDSHCHISCIGAAFNQVDLSEATSISEIIQLCKDFINEHPDKVKNGLRSMGWNQDLFTEEKRILTKDDLDKISTDIPIVLERVCGHICAANSKAMELFNIDRNTIPPEGGTIMKDSNGEPNGVFTENAVAWIEKVIPDYTLEEKVSFLKEAMDYALSVGLTSVQSNDVGAPNVYGDFESIRYLYEHNLSNIRYRHQVTFNSCEEIREFVQGEKKNPIYQGNMLTMGPLKLFKDGSLGARTAVMRAPYEDDPGNYGVEAMSDALQEELCMEASKHGMQVVTHVIGDGAIEKTINAYEKTMTNGENTLRHSLVHCQITDKPLLERIARLGILVQYQPIFLDYDMHAVESRCGKALSSTSYAFNTLDKLGGKISYGTDAPVEDCNPFPNIYSAVTRKDKTGWPEGGFYPEEKVDVYTAIDAYTIGSAYCEFMEDKKGRVKEGYLADLTVINQDIFTIKEEDIKDIDVYMTIVGGEVVYQK